MHSARVSARRGFTLIELLVVIGIIGILAGLLLPALTKAMERGRAVRCLNNQKQMSLAVMLYTEDHQSFPPGRIAGYTQWDLCVGPYVGGKADPFSPEARTALFMCPSVKVSNKGTHLNYSANPNIFKEVVANVASAAPGDLRRPTEAILAGDAVQYTSEGASHAILWGILGSSGSAVYWNDGDERNASKPIQVGTDKDQVYPTGEAAGANFRYRHGTKQVNVFFADGHASRITKGRIEDRNLYTNY